MNALFVSLLAVVLLPCILTASLSKFDFEELNDDFEKIYWREGNWKACKDGKQWRAVECFHEFDGKEYQVYLQACRDNLDEAEPAHERDCRHSGPQPVNPKENGLEWRVGDWQQCKDGKQWRPVECFHKQDGKEYQVYLKACRDAIGDEEPIHEKDCNHSGPQPVEPDASDLYWKTGEWEECVNGRRWRFVRCYDKNKEGGEDYEVLYEDCQKEIGIEEPVQWQDC